MIRLSQRSYTNGQYFRPKPIIIERPDSRLVVVATPWGPVESAQRAAEIVVEQFETLMNEDVTSTFDNLPTLSASANRLRKGVLMANQYLFKNENAKILKCAVEILAFHYDHGVLSWVHVGGPHLVLSDGSNLHPVAYAADWMMQSQNRGPLFTQALGLENNVPLNLGSVRMNGDAQALIIARSHLPSALFAPRSKGEAFELEAVLRTLAEDDPEAPCWVAIAEFEEAVVDLPVTDEREESDTHVA